MDSQEFVKKIQRLHPLQAATIKFNRGQDTIVGLMRLRALVGSDGSLQFATSDNLVVMAVIQSRDWGHDHNRTVTVWGLSLADEGMLAAIARDVEAVEHPDHPAKSITSKRQKAREAALDELRNAIIPTCAQEAQDWGLSLGFEVTENFGFVVANFQVKHGDNVLRTIGIDGWSGCIYQQGPTTRRYTNPQQLQELLNKAILEVAEEVTA